MDRNKQIKLQQVHVSVGSSQKTEVIGHVVGAYTLPGVYGIHLIIEPGWPNEVRSEVIAIFPTMMIPADFHLVQVLPPDGHNGNTLPTLIYSRTT